MLPGSLVRRSRDGPDETRPPLRAVVRGRSQKRQGQSHANAQEAIMDEIYKMLGREHQADLDREASKRALASSLPCRPGLTQHAVAWFRRLARRRPAAGDASVGAVLKPSRVGPRSPRRATARWRGRERRRVAHDTRGLHPTTVSPKRVVAPREVGLSDGPHVRGRLGSLDLRSFRVVARRPCGRPTPPESA